MPRLDARVARGMAAQLERRRERLASGERPLGWKVGFGAPAAMARLGIDRPLVGFLTDRGLLADGDEVAVGGWHAPAIEPEIAVRVGEDLGIEALAPAIELADVDGPPTDPERILAGNIFHRHVLLGPFDPQRRDVAGIVARVELDGEEVARTDDPEALPGRLPEVVAVVAEVLSEAGEPLRPGDVIITGSVVPPLQVRPGQRATVDLGALGALGVALGH